MTVSSTGRSLTLVVTRTPPLATLRLPTESSSSISCTVSPCSLEASPLLGLVALHDGHGLLDLLVGRTRRDQGLAAASRLGVAAGVVLAEAALDDLGDDLLLVAFQDLDVLVLEAGLEQLVDQLLRDLGALDRADHGRCHLGIFLAGGGGKGRGSGPFGPARPDHAGRRKKKGSPPPWAPPLLRRVG